MTGLHVSQQEFSGKKAKKMLYFNALNGECFACETPDVRRKNQIETPRDLHPWKRRPIHG